MGEGVYDFDVRIMIGVGRVGSLGKVGVKVFRRFFGLVLEILIVLYC